MPKNLKRLELSDINTIQKALQRCYYEESNHNVVNLYMWQNWYPIWIEEHDDYLILIGLHEGRFFSYMPLCELQYFSTAIHRIKEIFEEMNEPFALSCFTKSMKDRVIELMPHLETTAQEASFDYIYDAEKLRTLSGKKYQKRRNHLNAFLKEYEGRYQYVSLSHEYIPECLEFLTSWKSEVDDLYLRYEKDGAEYILKHYDLFECEGGVILIDGAVQAFVIGTCLSDDMVQLNIMKANTQIRGIYQAIEKFFLNDVYVDAVYVNKEDDAGSEALRKAKRAYNPICLIEKYWISEP